MYDIFFIGDRSFYEPQWQKLKNSYPTVKNASTLEEARQKCFTKFFWIVWPDLDVVEDFNFDYTPDEWSQDYIHVFKNNDEYDGIVLFPRKAQVTERELNHRFFLTKKEVDIVASMPTKYEIFYVDTYEEYTHALESSKYDMFWVVPPTVKVLEDFKFDTYFTHHNSYDRRINHMFLNGQYHDGVMLCSKKLKISKREWLFKFIAGKKEHDDIASMPYPYDVVFISYQEPDAEQNYQNLLNKIPNAKRVHGVKGIHNAHIEAAKLCNTPMIWIVDGDATIVDDFNFDYQVPAWQYNHVHVWRSKNPVNGLVYGYGGVKLFPRELTENMDTSKPDMTTSISDKFVAVKKVSNITGFNTGEFETWKSAFRECCKLSSKIIDRQKDNETNMRLKIWTTIGKDKPFGEYAISGARAGMAYGSANKDDKEALKLINDFDWLKDQFDGNT